MLFFVVVVVYLFLKAYLEQYSFKNVKEIELWSLMENFLRTKSNKREEVKDFTEKMMQWTKQSGHPIVHIKQLDETRIQMTQERFLFDSLATQEDKDFRWPIPFTYSIETVGAKNPDTIGANASNLNEKIIWLETDKLESKFR